MSVSFGVAVAAKKPNWAGYRTKGYLEDDSYAWMIKIQYSEDGRRYKGHVYFEENGEDGKVAGPCQGEVDVKGKLNLVECDLYEIYIRSLGVYDNKCFTLAQAINSEFNMYRTPLTKKCSKRSFLERWKTGK